MATARSGRVVRRCNLGGMRLDSHLDDGHAHLADAMMSLLRAGERDPALDPRAMKEIAELITKAQERLLRLSAQARRKAAPPS